MTHEAPSRYSITIHLVYSNISLYFIIHPPKEDDDTASTINMKLPHITPSMPHCQNCDAFVSRQYARVFTPDGIANPRVCPNCEDKVRDGNSVRDVHN